MTETQRESRQKPRRRPRQARSWATSLAIQEAFVRVLLERGYERTPIREVALVAGVGIGTFYEYFPNKEALAAVCLRTRMKAVVAQLATLAAEPAHSTLGSLVDAMLDELVRSFTTDATQWAALLQLERRISTPAAYQKLYRMALDMWAGALGGARTWTARVSVEEVAYVLHTASYSLVTQRVMLDAERTDAAALRRQVGVMVHAYLDAVTGKVPSKIT
ncbi:MAG: helix-turn-helix domain-containing protein [Pseudomonadota bacterium]